VKITGTLVVGLGPEVTTDPLGRERKDANPLSKAYVTDGRTFGIEYPLMMSPCNILEIKKAPVTPTPTSVIPTPIIN